MTLYLAAWNNASQRFERTDVELLEITFDETLSRGKPVSVLSTGNAGATDISSQQSSYGFIGLASEDTSSGNIGRILTAGSILANIPSGYSMTGQWPKPVFVSPTGTLTLDIPAIGTNGYLEGHHIIRIGTIYKGTSGGTNLLVNPCLVGVL